AGLSPARLRRENSTNRLDSPASSLLGARRNPAPSATEHFFNGLLRIHIRDFPDELRPTTIVGLSNNSIVRSGFGKAVSAQTERGFFTEIFGGGNGFSAGPVRDDVWDSGPLKKPP
ncbi:MAG: hypothetical protein J7M21_02255, partial [Planctomycetes bacterium]|nr:hypothetical protein [Planctomycetota bacterium]